MESRVIEQTMYDYFKLVGKTAIVTGEMCIRDRSWE